MDPWGRLINHVDGQGEGVACACTMWLRALLLFTAHAAALRAPLAATASRRRHARPRCCADLAPCELHGVSISDTGLVALLADAEKQQLLPLPVTDSDVQSAESAAALCLLQLLQSIDLAGPSFPPERLSSIAGDLARLEAVELEAGASSFTLRLAGPDGPRSPVGVEPFDALALSLRYRAPLLAPPAAFAAATAFPATECEVRFPMCYTRRDATMQRDKITRQLAGLGEKPDELDAGFSFASPGSLDIVEAVVQALPPPAAAAGGSPGRVRSIDGPDTALLERALAIAREKGDDAARQRIEAKLAELSE